MDALLSTSAVEHASPEALFVSSSSKHGANALVVDQLKPNKEDSTKFGVHELSTSLTITAEEVIQKLNELLKKSVPEGIQSLKPQDHTPEKTAERIVNSVTGLFSAYEQQHPELEGEELVTGFMDTIRGGIQKGYDQAFKALEEIGAFEFDGVQSGVEQTKLLIEDKLINFEQKLREKLGIETPEVTEESIATPSSDEFLQLGGVRTLDVAA